MDIVRDQLGRPFHCVAEIALAEVDDPPTRKQWESAGILAALELEPVHGVGTFQGFLLEDGSIAVADESRQINGHRNGRRRNPEESAAALAGEWYGRPAETVTEVEQDVHFHEYMADLGLLVELELAPLSGRRPTKVIPLEFARSENMRLASNETGDQLFIVGGVRLNDQTLARLGVPEIQRGRESVILGECTAVAYHAAKHTNAHKAATYRHAFGEEGGELPLLIWRPLNGELLLEGGSYTVESPGIIN